MTDKKTWGGKRIGFHCMVEPTTKDRIKQAALKTKSSAGQIVDELASKLGDE